MADEAVNGVLDRSVLVPALSGFRNPFSTKQSISVSVNVTRRQRRPLRRRVQSSHIGSAAANRFLAFRLIAPPGLCRDQMHRPPSPVKAVRGGIAGKQFGIPGVHA